MTKEREIVITPDLLRRFWEKVNKTDSCWLWTASKNSTGYGKCTLSRGVWTRSHRVSWTIHHGPIPAGMDVCHNCPCGDNPACVNPAHLWLGTHAENMKDRDQKGRHSHCGAKGITNGNAKLTDSEVKEILRRLQQGETCTSIGRTFGVSQVLVSYIKLGRAWKHIARVT